MFRQMIRQVYHAGTYSLTGKIENIVGMSIEASGGQAAVGDICYGYYVAQAEAVKALGEALPVIYAGVAMGQFFKGSLRPDPALAFFCGLNREAVSAAELDEAQALCYLRRQEVAAGAFAEGVNLVCARGRALGFAKRIGNRVNNMYPNTLRIIKR